MQTLDKWQRAPRSERRRHKAKRSAARLRSRPQRRTDLAAASVACAVSALAVACRRRGWHPTQQAARCRCRCGVNAPDLLRTLHALTHRVQLSSQLSHLGHRLGCARSRRLGLSRDRWALACLPPQQLKIGPQLAGSVLGRLPHVSGWAVHRCAAARVRRASAGGANRRSQGHPPVSLGRGWASRQRGEGGPRDGTCPLRSSQLRLLCERLSQPKLELRQRVLQPLQVGLRLLPRRRLLCQFEARRALLHVRRPPLRW